MTKIASVACAWAFELGRAVRWAGCNYCNWESTNVSKQALRDHVEKDCPNHPLRAMEKRINYLEAELEISRALESHYREW